MSLASPILSGLKFSLIAGLLTCGIGCTQDLGSERPWANKRTDVRVPRRGPAVFRFDVPTGWYIADTGPRGPFFYEYVLEPQARNQSKESSPHIIIRRVKMQIPAPVSESVVQREIAADELLMLHAMSDKATTMQMDCKLPAGPRSLDIYRLQSAHTGQRLITGFISDGYRYEFYAAAETNDELASLRQALADVLRSLRE